MKILINAQDVVKYDETEPSESETHKVFEAGAKTEVLLEYERNDWNANSKISFDWLGYGVQLYFGTANGSNGAHVVAGKLYTLADIESELGDPTVISDLESIPLYLVTKYPSGGWDEVVVNATVYISPAGSTSGSNSEYLFSFSASDCATAYRITIETMEKPWGGSWDGTTGGERTQDGKLRQWFHLWEINENAIRPLVAPLDLSEWVTDTGFICLGADPFIAPSTPPDANAIPKWRRITAGAGTNVVIPTLTVGDEGTQLLGEQTPVDIVINAIDSVEWEPDDLNNGIKLDGNSSDNGFHCFPEMDAPNGTLHNTIKVKVSLRIAILSEMFDDVSIKLFDPDNPLDVDQNDSEGDNNYRPDDNNGSAVLTAGVIHFSLGQKVNTDVLRFTKAHAGDDYIVAAHPNGDTLALYRFKPNEGKTLQRPDDDDWVELDEELQTKILTVWRTLWLELDQMAAIALNDPPPEPNPSLAEKALAAACVDVKKVPCGWNSTPTATFANPLGQATNPNYLGVSNSCRDILLNQVSESFWCIHGIGAYINEWNSWGLSTETSEGGAFFVFITSATNYCNEAELNGKPYEGGLNEQLARTAYHEIMHYLGFDDVYKVQTILDQIVIDTCAVMEDLENILARHNGNVWPFAHDPDIQALYSSLDDWETLLWNKLQDFVGSDTNQGIMDYDTISFGTWDDIKLKPFQIERIQGLTKPIPMV